MRDDSAADLRGVRDGSVVDLRAVRDDSVARLADQRRVIAAGRKADVPISPDVPDLRAGRWPARRDDRSVALNREPNHLVRMSPDRRVTPRLCSTDSIVMMMAN